MRIFLLVLGGVISGVFAGMGMGGGTILVPFLSLVFGLGQVVCQSTNVICFLCLSVICVIVFLSKKLIDFTALLAVGIPAFFVSGICCFLAIHLQFRLLKILFACFVILLGVISFCRVCFWHRK